MSALSRVKDELEKLRSRQSSIRARAAKSAEMVQRDAMQVASAYAYGAWRKNGGTLPAIGGLDTDEVAVLALYALGHFSSGKVAEVARDASVGIACAYAYRKAQA